MPATTNPNSTAAGKTSSSPAASSDRIADYFCIVGAGDSLQLKHGGGHNPTHTHTNEEDKVHQDCALVERFYREIVDVKLLSGKEDELEAAKLEGYVILRHVHSLNPNKNNHAHTQSNPHPRPGSHSEHSSNQEHFISANLNPHDLHKSNSKFLNQVIHENISSNDHENKRSPGRITLAAATACYHNYEEYASTLKTSKVPSSTSSPDPSTSTSPNKFNSLLGKGQSKLLSKFSNQNHNKEQPEQRESMQEEEYYLAYRRRVPDDSHLPAISDVRIFYIRLPKQELQFNNNDNRKSSAPDKSRNENKSHKQKWNDALSKGGVLWQKAAGTAQNILKHPHMQDAHSLNRSSSNISHIQNRTFMNTPSTKLARSFDLHGDSDEDDHSREHMNCQSDNQSVGWRSMSGMSVQSNTPSVDAVGNRVSVMELLKVSIGVYKVVNTQFENIWF